MLDRPTLATNPEDLERLFVERVNAGDLDGAAALYEQEAVLADPLGEPREGREAIRAALEPLIARGLRLAVEEELPTVRRGDLALTSTRGPGPGVRVQVARRQPDGSWRRVIDMLEPGVQQQDARPASGASARDGRSDPWRQRRLFQHTVRC